MITIRKLARLRPGTRTRKVVRILAEVERTYSASGNVEPGAEFLRALAALVLAEPDLSTRVHDAAVLVEKLSGGENGGDAGDLPLLRALNGLRHALLSVTGDEPAEWDLLAPQDSGSSEESAARFPISLYLEDLRSPFNVGSIIRTAAAFGAERVVMSPETAPATHPRALRSAMGATRLIALDTMPLDVLSTLGVPIVALEQGGTPIEVFPFPDNGVVIVGSEELGVSPAALDLADRSSGRVSIPLWGPKASLNVGVAVGILLSVWTARKKTAVGGC